MNLHGYISETAVIEHAHSLWRAGRLVYSDGQWRWSAAGHRLFAGTLAKPFNSVLRRAQLDPEKLHEKFAAREFVC